MKRYNCAQGGQEWINRRLGIPTASEFHRIVTPTGKLSEQSKGYMCRLLAELMLGKHLDEVETKWMVRGSDLEEAAVKLYEFRYNCDTEPVGFITNDAGTVGASPDRIVGTKRGVEIKSPAPNTQVARLLSGTIDGDYRPQLQGQIWICEFDEVDNVYFHPDMPASVVRVSRDEKYIALLANAVGAFVDVLRKNRYRLEQEFGPFPEIDLEPKREDCGSLGITDQDIDELIADKFGAQCQR